MLLFVLGGCGLYQQRKAVWKGKQVLGKRNKSIEELVEVRGRMKDIIELKLKATGILETADRLLGRKYMEIGSYNLAEEVLLEAEHLKPNNAYIKKDLAECYYLLGMSTVENDERPRYYDRSRMYYRKALELSPGMTEARYGHGLLLFFGYGNVSDAVEEMKTILEIDPSHAEARFALGRFYYESGELSKALGEYLALTRVLPRGSPKLRQAEENIERINREMSRQ